MKCNASLSIGDDYGDNSSTFHCQLEDGHTELHQEQFVSDSKQRVIVTWTKYKVMRRAGGT